MATDHLLTETRDRVLYLTLNRPDKLNAMSAEMMGALADNLHRASTDPGVGCVVVTGAGRGFCSGGDIGGMRARKSPPAPRRQLRIGWRACAAARMRR